MKLRLLFLLAAPAILCAETGAQAWLRYAPVNIQPVIPAVVASTDNSVLVTTARNELVRGVRGMLGRTLRIEAGDPTENAIVLRVTEAGKIPEGYWLHSVACGKFRCLEIAGTPRGILYGTFALLRKIALGQPIANLDEHDAPSAPVRWINHWDNLDGTIERGYGGRSIFWENGHAREDLSRVSDYGRLLASLGINACAINNVNSDRRILTPGFLPEIARIADAFRPWGVRVVISVDFGSPKAIGGLDTFDPLDPAVAAWWKSKADAIYAAIPDLGGFVVKADSEGRVGPSTYGRTHADAANVVARALAPHGGLIFYRGFVYDHHMDWNNLKNDRARAAYDNFQPLDGKFDDNAVIQIKHGPIDFQVREPASPLFAALKNTNQAIELQITQEYFGQARHTVFLVPMWKETLDFAMPMPVKEIVARRTGGFVGVANVGLDDNWLGNHLSQANLYGFGRLAWNPNLSAAAISGEWRHLTFGSDPEVSRVVNQIQLTSWRTFENYTGPLGLQTLTDIAGNHYGVAVEASENNGWGQWHRADEKGVGMDRTVATGTGYIGQYPPATAKVFESLASCPDALLLFMHHVPYTYRLHSGKTVIQYLYDSHYEGAAAVAEYAGEWKSLKGRVDDQRYAEVLAQLQYQIGQAQVWRDAVNGWFLKTSGIPDAKGRAGHFPGRIEAESMTLDGYVARKVTPWETASGGTAIACPATQCTARMRYDGAPGWYTLQVQYFDQIDGVSKFRVYVGEQLIDEWTAALRIPTRKMDGSSSTARVISGVALRPSDELRIEGTPDGGELAGLDYVEIRR